MKVIPHNGKEYLAFSKDDEVRVIARLKQSLGRATRPAERDWLQKSIDRVTATFRLQGFTVSSMTEDQLIALLLQCQVEKNIFDDGVQLSKRDSPSPEDHLRHRMNKLKGKTQ